MDVTQVSKFFSDLLQNFMNYPLATTAATLVCLLVIRYWYQSKRIDLKRSELKKVDTQAIATDHSITAIVEMSKVIGIVAQSIRDNTTQTAAIVSATHESNDIMRRQFDNWQTLLDKNDYQYRQLLDDLNANSLAIVDITAITTDHTHMIPDEVWRHPQATHVQEQLMKIRDSVKEMQMDQKLEKELRDKIILLENELKKLQDENKELRDLVKKSVDVK